jgi:hypothetical protein
MAATVTGRAKRELAPMLNELSLFTRAGRGLHSFTSQLNLSAVYGIGGARRGCVARVEGVLGGVCGM